MQKLNAQLGIAMQQAGQSSSQPMLLPQLLAANPQLQQQMPLMMSNAPDMVSHLLFGLLVFHQPGIMLLSVFTRNPNHDLLPGSISRPL